MSKPLLSSLVPYVGNRLWPEKDTVLQLTTLGIKPQGSLGRTWRLVMTFALVTQVDLSKRKGKANICRADRAHLIIRTRP